MGANLSFLPENCLNPLIFDGNFSELPTLLREYQDERKDLFGIRDLTARALCRR